MAGWERLAAALERRGHRAFPVDLPVDRPDLLAAGYAGIAAAQFGETVREPVVVAHSGGGLLLPAMAGALQASRLVWLAAAIPDLAGGSSFAEEAANSDIVSAEWREFSAEWRVQADSPAADPVAAAYFLFHDCDLATVRWALSTLNLFYPVAVYAETPIATSLPPSTYVLPRHDRTLRPDWMRTTARKRLGVEPVEVDGGHCPHVSRPEPLADLLA